MNKVFIPVSIIVAGLIIGGAVVLTNNAENINPQTVENDKPEFELAPITNDDHILGNPDAEVLIVEYSDFQCPFCGRFHGTMKRIIEEYGDSGQVGWVFRHFPIQSHQTARPLAEASECVADLAGEEAFWDFSDQVFAQVLNNIESNQRDYGVQDDRAKEIALSLGVDEGAYDTCVSERQTQERVERDYQDGLEIAKVDPNFGTPYNILISKSGVQVPIVGNQPYAAVKSLIDAVLFGDPNAEGNSEETTE